jgi:hypothetical protein
MEKITFFEKCLPKIDINQIQYFSYYFKEKYYKFRDFIFKEDEDVKELFLILEGEIKFTKSFSYLENQGSPKSQFSNLYITKIENKKRIDIYNCGKEDFVGIHDIFVGNQKRIFDCQITSLDGAKVSIYLYLKFNILII